MTTMIGMLQNEAIQKLVENDSHFLDLIQLMGKANQTITIWVVVTTILFLISFYIMFQKLHKLEEKVDGLEEKCSKKRKPFR